MARKRAVLVLGLGLVATLCWSAGTQQAATQRPELSMLLSVSGTISFENNAVVQMAEDLSGYTLLIEAPPAANYWDRMRLVMASSQIPDIHANGVGDDFERFAREGLIADIEDKIGNYPNLMRNLTEPQWEDGRSATTGRIMAVPRANATDYWGYIIRKDWLDAVGMEAPRTLAEYAAVTRAFTLQDPNRSGRQDTYGYSFSRGLWSLNTEHIKTAFGLSVHDGFPDPTGEYTIRWLNPGYVPYLTYLRELQASGGLDPEWFTQARGADNEKFLQGRIGTLYISQNGLFSFFDQNPQLNHNDYLFVAPLANPTDGVRRMAAPPSNWMAFLMAADGKVDDSLRFLDWANSEEGFKLFHFGIQGEHYNSYDIETRVIDRTPEQHDLARNFITGGFIFANAYLGRRAIEGGLTPATREKFVREWGQVRSQSSIIEMPFVKVPDLTAVRTSIPDQYTRIQAMEEQFVLGEITREQFVAELARFTSHPVVQQAQRSYAAFMAENEVR